MELQRGFKHEGVVKRVEQGVVEVEVGVIAACEGCKAKESCATGKGTNVRVIRVECDDAWQYMAGERVGVAISYGVGFMAVMLMYVAPLLFLIAALVILVALGVEEGVAAILSLATVGFYYWILYRDREKFERKVKFKLTKIGC
ncbi:MAG: SoxR reducing system RseC family protein [Rikenellaceae bacterium]